MSITDVLISLIIAVAIFFGFFFIFFQFTFWAFVFLTYAFISVFPKIFILSLIAIIFLLKKLSDKIFSK